MRLSLIRLAAIYFTTEDERWRHWSIRFGEMSVHSLDWAVEGTRARLAAYAEIELPYPPKLTSSRHLVIPPRSRSTLESGIEAVANLIAVGEGSERIIRSPLPSVAFCAHDEEAREYLSRAGGFLRPKGTHGATGATYRVDVRERLHLLGDRMDGVALLAEALTHEHSTGRFHELMRLFERAFRLSAKRLIHPLAEFLSGASLNFTEPEVREWILRVRHPATHADVKDEFLLEADVRPYIGRMEQAAYDVLFNKSAWRNGSTDRRQGIAPSTGPTSRGSDIFIRKGEVAQNSLKIALLDEFGAYPRDLHPQGVPEDWLILPFQDDRGS